MEYGKTTKYSLNFESFMASELQPDG